MSNRPVLTYYPASGDNITAVGKEAGRAIKLDCSQVIFLLVSDIGSDQLMRTLMRFKHRDEVPQYQLRQVITYCIAIMRLLTKTFALRL